MSSQAWMDDHLIANEKCYRHRKQISGFQGLKGEQNVNGCQQVQDLFLADENIKFREWCWLHNAEYTKSNVLYTLKGYTKIEFYSMGITSQKSYYKKNLCLISPYQFNMIVKNLDTFYRDRKLIVQHILWRLKFV